MNYYFRCLRVSAALSLLLVSLAVSVQGRVIAARTDEVEVAWTCAPPYTVTPSATTTTTASTGVARATQGVVAAPHWGQCGGSGWNLVPCQEPFICSFVNEYFSQCIPPKTTTTTATWPSSGVCTPSTTSTITSIVSTSTSSSSASLTTTII